MIRRFPISVFLTLALVQLAHATTVRRLSFDDLVRKSEVIVAGQVTDSRSYWTSDKKLILTSYTVQVGESIKGKAPRTITVTTVGGRIANTILKVSGMPEFQRGENAVIFLEHSGNYWTLVGLNQGKFSTANGEVSNTVAGLAFPDGRPGSRLKIPVDEFKRQIKLRITQ